MLLNDFKKIFFYLPLVVVTFTIHIIQYVKRFWKNLNTISIRLTGICNDYQSLGQKMWMY